jgi:SAM-dependent methyltransferase
VTAAAGSIFEWRSPAHLLALAQACGFEQDLCVRIVAAYEQYRAAHKTKIIAEGPTGDLERRWYMSLSRDIGSPDYTVYADPFYLADIWLCWTMYSRRGLLELCKPLITTRGSVISVIGKTQRVVDLGCGFGYTTAALKEIFGADTQVIGTNRRDSFQYRVAEVLGQQRGFEMTEQYRGPPVDVVYASEYFEHFPEPLAHAYEVLSCTRPRYLIVANGFNGRAIGHFNHYLHEQKLYSASTMSKMFNRLLRALGYRSLKTRIWNNRPAIWCRAVNRGIQK